MGDLEIDYEQAAARKVISALLEALPGLTWLDGQKEWFTLSDARRNRLSNVIRKILCASPEVSIAEMRGALQRVHRLSGFSPPRAILREFCKTLSFCRISDDRIIALGDLSIEEILGENEKCILEVFKDCSHVMHISKLRDECMRRGMNANTFSVYLGNSPIVTRLAPETYAIIGAAVSPGEVEDLQLNKVARAPVIRDHGWIGDGRLWLSYRLTVSNIRAGVFPVPAALRDIADGEYFIQSADTGSRCAIRIQGGRLSGVRRPLNILGAEEGDIVRLILDPRTRQAEISFSGEAVEAAATQSIIDSERLDVPDYVQGETQSASAGASPEVEWQPVSTAPIQRDLEVRLEDSSGRYALLFPCRLLSEGTWINSWLNTPLLAVPIDWREWREDAIVF